jgi:hypothetical protein
MDPAKQTGRQSAQQDGERFSQKMGCATNMKFGVIAGSPDPFNFARLDEMCSLSIRNRYAPCEVSFLTRRFTERRGFHTNMSVRSPSKSELSSDAAQTNLETVVSDRLQEIVCCSQIERLKGIVALRGKEHDDGVHRLAEQPREIETARFHHLDVNKDNVRLERPDLRQRIFSRRCFCNNFKIPVSQKAFTNGRYGDRINIDQDQADARMWPSGSFL